MTKAEETAFLRTWAKEANPGEMRLAKAGEMLSLREVASNDQEALNLDRRRVIQTAVDAHADFQAACRELTNDYRLE